MKTALITGASRGIGAAIATSFAENGYNVAINYNKSDKAAKELCAELGARGFSVAPFFADIKSEQNVTDMYGQIANTFGGVDVLVNNAGISAQSLFTNITAHDWDEMFAVNVRGAFFASRAALPHMISRKWGRIINISSMWGEVGASCEVHYSASKAALIGLTKALAQEEAPSGITVNCVSPGAVSTDMMSAFTQADIAALCSEIPLSRLGQASEIASAVLFLASARASYITGQVLSVNGGMVI